jgi:hypothetical protein
MMQLRDYFQEWDLRCILNHAAYANANAELAGDVTSGIFGCGCSSPDVNIGNPVIGTGSNRDIQFGLKIIF